MLEASAVTSTTSSGIRQTRQIFQSSIMNDESSMRSTNSRSASISSLSDFDAGQPNVVYGSLSEIDRSLNDLLLDFKGKCEALERQLEMFASSVRQLGSSLGLYKGSREFQQKLSSIRRLLDEEPQVERLFNEILSRDRHSPKIFRQTEKWVHQDLWLLVDAIGIFSTAWDDFPEFVDNDRRHFLTALEQHLLVWLNILGFYEHSPEFGRCVRELMFDTILELDHVTRRLADFIATGVQEISFAQRHSTQILLNSATIATFFSAVTVTTLQYTIPGPQSVASPLQIAVNALWFSSLVLSVSCAINSLLAMTWRQAIYSTPQRRVPWWVRIWFKQTPIVLLSLSVLSFLAGLLCYVFLTQDMITTIVVSTLTSIVALGLGAISVWFAWERWDFSRVRRKLWLQEAHEKLESSRWMFMVDYVMGSIWRPRTTSLPTRSSLARRRSRFSPIPTSTTAGEKVNEPENAWDILKSHVRSRGQDLSSRDVNQSRIATINMNEPGIGYSNAIFAEFDHQTLLRESDDFIRDVQFSPKGTWFAACTRSTCYIYQVKPHVDMHQILKHPFGRIRQLEWSPGEKWLLIRVSGGIELWEIRQVSQTSRHVLYLNQILQNKLGICQKEWIGKVVKKVQWINDMAFLVLNEDGLVRFNISDGGHLTQGTAFSFDRTLHTFAVVPPGNHILVIGAHRSRVHEDIPFPRRTIRSVTTYNLITGQPLQSFPLLRDVRWISISCDGVHALFGFNHRPPELWSFEGEKISFKHRFLSDKDRFSGPPHFVGPRDEFVACASLAGSIHIWKRDENEIVLSLAMPLASNRSPELGGAAAIPMMTWNRGTAMFASAAAEVNFWMPKRSRSRVPSPSTG
ncbi:WD40-repeat-containing domain protein [Mycena sp. CBHHK59/15]|nr:WD40-repeat-containing domain protein [Mycena sp. CBHHK59/15]